jgi:hypothetical protein
MCTHTGIQIVLYVLWGAAMVSLAFVMSALFSSARTATVAAYLFVFASGLLGYMLVRYLLDLGGRAWWAVFLQFLPPLALYRCVCVWRGGGADLCVHGSA